MIKIINHPLGKKKVRKMVDDNGFLEVVIKVDMSDLLNHNLESFNDLVEEKILKHGILYDISYKPALVLPNEECIGILVSAFVDADYLN